MPKKAIHPRDAITLDRINAAHKEFTAIEPRDLFYRAATELIELACLGQSKLTVAEALAVLLQTWNRTYYRFKKRFDIDHYASIEGLWTKHSSTLRTFRKMSIRALDADHSVPMHNLFEDFELVLGPVGAAKALHLLAPRFFPLWDRRIAKHYGLSLDRSGTKSDHYWRFAEISKKQCQTLLDQGFPANDNPLKAIDEFNYVQYTLKELRDLKERKSKRSRS